MKIYAKTVERFLKDVEEGRFLKELAAEYQKLLGSYSDGEYRAWENSVEQYMFSIIRKSGIPLDSGIAVEYQVPGIPERIDLLLTGFDERGTRIAIIVELKQWSRIECSENVESFEVSLLVNGQTERRDHPSYQANYYKRVIEGALQCDEQSLNLCPIVVLHNYEFQGKLDPLLQNKFSNFMRNIPAFFKSDSDKLADFLRNKIKYGDNGGGLDYIEQHCRGISVKVQRALKEWMVKKDIFQLNAEQQRMVLSVKKLLGKAKADGQKRVIIIKGDPGTGKTVVALKLVADCLCDNPYMNCYYVAKNKAIRDILKRETKDEKGLERIKSSIVYPTYFKPYQKNIASISVVDEAQRLNEEEQIDCIIRASVVSVFFVDERQIVSFEDIGTVDVIEEYAHKWNAGFIDAGKLRAQFRCGGTGNYIKWVDELLEIDKKEKLNKNPRYDIQMVDKFENMRFELADFNKKGHEARIVAGYCWSWKTRLDQTRIKYDFILDGVNLRWNNSDKVDSSIWAVGDTFDQIGCIHTCQGLQFDYIGVVIGEDLRYENNEVIADISKRASDDGTVSRKSREQFLRKYGEEKTKKREIDIVKNTYRVLLTRGISGCRIYCLDAGLREYIRDSIEKLGKEC